MAYNSTLRKKVRQIARDEQSKLTDADIFESTEFKDYLQNMAKSMLGAKGASLKITIADDGPGQSIAWTTGNHVHLNRTSVIATNFPSVEQRFVAMMGLFFHEMAHNLFLDFDEEKRAHECIQNGVFVGDEPQNRTAEEDASWQEMLKALQNPVARKVFATVFHEVANICNDVHDEDAIIDRYGSFVGEGICLCANALQSNCDLFEDMQNDLKRSKLSLAYNLLLQTVRFDTALCKDYENLKTSEFGTFLKKVQQHARIACVSDDVLRRFSEYNAIMLALWPFIRDEIQNAGGQGDGQPNQPGGSGDPGSQNGGGGQSQPQQGTNDASSNQSSGDNSGNSPFDGGQLTPEQVQQILDQLQQGAKNAGQTQAPQNGQSSQTAIDARVAERTGKTQPQPKDKGQGNDPAQKGSTQGLYQALENIQKAVAENKAEDKMEKAAKQQMIDMVVAVDQTSPHKNVPLRFERPLSVTSADRDTYNREMHELLPVSKRLQRQIENALRDLKDGYVAKHKLYGDLEAGDAYRPDGRMFSKKKLPQDLPDMAISVLVDHSGSMSGERIRTAMRAAMLLHDFATGIGAPVSVAGHYASGGRVVYIDYTDFEDISGKDRFRLAKMDTAGRNRDGMALNISAGLLEKRPEEIKLLILISDGRPNHDNYGGKAAAEDIREIVKKCRRKGIEVIAAGIGADRKSVQEIYQNEFLDIGDLQKLPKIMTNIVKKRVLRNAL